MTTEYQRRRADAADEIALIGQGNRTHARAKQRRGCSIARPPGCCSGISAAYPRPGHVPSARQILQRAFAEFYELAHAEPLAHCVSQLPPRWRGVLRY
jgi:hypothetical protein